MAAARRCLRRSRGRRDDQANKQTRGPAAPKTSLLADIKSMLAEAAECGSSSILGGELAIWSVQPVFFNDMFELFLMAARNGNINLSGCAITKTGMVYSPLGDRRRTMTYYRLAGSGH